MSDQEKLVVIAQSKDELDEIVAGTVEGHCHRCGRAVCLAPTSQAFLKEHPDAEICCWSCLTPEERAAVKGGKVVLELMKGQRKEILQYVAYRRRN